MLNDLTLVPSISYRYHRISLPLLRRQFKKQNLHVKTKSMLMTLTVLAAHKLSKKNKKSDYTTYTQSMLMTLTMLAICSVPWYSASSFMSTVRFRLQNCVCQAPRSKSTALGTVKMVLMSVAQNVSREPKASIPVANWQHTRQRPESFHVQDGWTHLTAELVQEK